MVAAVEGVSQLMAGTARERPMELSSADVARLGKVFVCPVSEVSIKLKKNWKVSD